MKKKLEVDKKFELDKKYEPDNGSMAHDLEEMELLGKQMDRLRTNEELKKDEKQPDPVQYKEKDK
ncbi:hypothetical protein HP456_02995 [Bacillus haikouensis]|jgi:hypothetical protein|uniref:hypothetical protein n=1 Tax=Bacillus haikouensis TaxID=1510468 RepID=UPI0015517165|nr:hypothetical protein [Bacillus haikouensis]NQD64896.1 hypothetical protein [Bacillus haikouensis]